MRRRKKLGNPIEILDSTCNKFFMKILLATHNPAKFARYKKLLDIIGGMEVFSLADLNIIEKVEEDLSSSQGNAEKKVRIYAGLSGLPTLAVDEAAQTNFLPDHEQPGVYMRRIGKDREEMNDDGVLKIWQETFEKYPQKDKQFIWDFSLAYLDPKSGLLGMTTVKQISHVGKYVSEKQDHGYPLSRILSPEKDGAVYVEQDQEAAANIELKIFAKFFEEFKEWKNKINN